MASAIIVTSRTHNNRSGTMDNYGRNLAEQQIARTRRTIEALRKQTATMPDTAETEVLVAYVESLEACARPAFDVEPVEQVTPARGMLANL
tara:strand:- start:56 stop:328 length:273 start_codon:yes stop_codon:yes gene_type:complete